MGEARAMCRTPLPMHRLAQQVGEGDNKAERPMWAEKGGLDFEGRARWDAWTARKGLAPDKAKLEFVTVSSVTEEVLDILWDNQCTLRSGVSRFRKLETWFMMQTYYEFLPKALYKDER
jgi:acyl-CoA-binding protein